VAGIHRSDCLPGAGWLEALMRKADCLRSEHAVFAGAIEMRASGPEPNIHEVYDLVKGIPRPGTSLAAMR